MKKFVNQFFELERDELPVILLLFISFFCSIAVFQILKPLKKGLFVEVYGAETELYAKLLNILTATVAMVVFTYLYNRLSRRGLIFSICGFFIVAFALLTLFLQDPDAYSIWGFYLVGDLVTTLLVAGFWAYATDITRTEQAKRLFGLIGLGLVLGGWAGIASARALLLQIGMEGLLVLCAGLMLVIAAATGWTEYLLPRSESFRRNLLQRQTQEKSVQQQTNAALEGASLALRSPYLVAIVGLMASYEIASQVMDYQFSSLAEQLSGVTETQAFMTDVYFFANMLSVLVQLFLVSLIMRKAGLVVTLLVMPAAILLSSLSFLFIPTLFVSGLLVISDNGLNYSIQQTGRETLYMITTPDEKYKARAFINMFVQRLAKGIAILAVLGLGALAVPLPFLSLLAIAAVVLMILCGVFAGRRFNRQSEQSE
ncbi:MAG: Npt1/Npt2 family nucleotide transporter [Acidobacteriota bacterium]